MAKSVKAGQSPKWGNNAVYQSTTSLSNSFLLFQARKEYTPANTYAANTSHFLRGKCGFGFQCLHLEVIIFSEKTSSGTKKKKSFTRSLFFFTATSTAAPIADRRMRIARGFDGGFDERSSPLWHRIKNNGKVDSVPWDAMLKGAIQMRVSCHVRLRGFT